MHNGTASRRAMKPITSRRGKVAFAVDLAPEMMAVKGCICTTDLGCPPVSPKAFCSSSMVGVCCLEQETEGEIGLAEYCERYAKTAEEYKSLGFAVFSHDHQGHGKSGSLPIPAYGHLADRDSLLSEGERVYIEHFADYVSDFYDYVQFVMEKYPA